MLRPQHIPSRFRASHGKWGLTMLELLVAIAVVAILAGLLVPIFGRARVSGQQAETTAKMRTAYQAILQHVNDYDGLLPVGWSEGSDPRGRTYGTWMFQLNRDGYLDPPSENLAMDSRFACDRQLSQQQPLVDDIRTLAMNNRIGPRPRNTTPDDPERDPQGPHRMIEFDRPSRTALLMNGNWTGTRYTTSVLPASYVDRMRGRTPFGDSVLVLFLDGHTELRPLQTIPTTIRENDSLDGYYFWLGGRRNPHGTRF